VAIGRLEYQFPETRGRPVSLAPRPAMLAGREDLTQLRMPRFPACTAAVRGTP
jgi:hypothetical protein